MLPLSQISGKSGISFNSEKGMEATGEFCCFASLFIAGSHNTLLMEVKMLALNSMFNPFIIIFILILAIPFVALTMFFLSKISGIGDIMSESNNLVQRENSTQKFLVYDPSFNEREFIIYVSNLYAEYRSCQDNKDVSTLRTKLTEALFSQLEMQTEELRRSGLTTHTEQMTLVNSWILCWKH